MTFQTGTLVGGRYRLEELIGSGGMGEVFRAQDMVLERRVAVKLVEAVDPRRREEITRSFLREARISAGLAHRNVVQILDFGTHEGVVPFMVMELLEGRSLADVLGAGEPLPLEWTFSIVDEVLDGLSVAHDQGVVHRDLKPENIYLAQTASGVHPKVLDFGISKILDASGSASITTTNGQVVGTPAYMSPEQARGVRAIDKRTDVYSMGVVLYELLSGEMPFFSENPGDLLIMIITEEALPLIELVPEVGEELSALVARAMSQDPDDRFADARELQGALVRCADRLLGTEASHRLGARERPVSWRKRAPTAAASESHALTVAGPTPRGLRSPRPPTPRRSRARKRMQPFMFAGGAAFLAGAIGGAAIWLGRSNASPSPRFIVVRADPGDSRPPPSESTASAPAETNFGATAQVSPLAPRAPEPTRPTEARPRDTAMALAESFRRQKANVVACVNEHAAEAERTSKLAVRFMLSAGGSVLEAHVLPSAVATSAMGTCIERAASAMRFPTQAAAISFEVPLTTKKGNSR